MVLGVIARRTTKYHGALLSIYPPGLNHMFLYLLISTSYGNVIKMLTSGKEVCVSIENVWAEHLGGMVVS